ncbi:hypothetical protein ADL29_24910 [Streptomyces chattanoogensis]|uniref:Lipoprotein n=1 Tax=Streptomyces chattanoogensis TaxID=66876 RepID=A0A0N0XT86_9ACTN|nr:hypothetical protein ADL29_24910 [Streptomyces chattanoogensis]
MRRQRRIGPPLTLVLTGLLLSGCGITDSKSNESTSEIPSAGTATTFQASQALKQVSSQIYDFAGVPGKASKPGPGVRECDGRDKDTYFQMYHPWNFAPTKASDIDVAMENLKKKLKTGGWAIKDIYHDNSPNKALNLIADNVSKKVSVWIIQLKKDKQPSFAIEVTSGCYKIPDGQEIDRF